MSGFTAFFFFFFLNELHGDSIVKLTYVGIMAHAYNPNLWRLKWGGHVLAFSQCYIVQPWLQTAEKGRCHGLAVKCVSGRIIGRKTQFPKVVVCHRCASGYIHAHIHCISKAVNILNIRECSAELLPDTCTCPEIQTKVRSH